VDEAPPPSAPELPSATRLAARGAKSTAKAAVAPGKWAWQRGDRGGDFEGGRRVVGLMLKGDLYPRPPKGGT
jgi:hypothetical protein